MQLLMQTHYTQLEVHCVPSSRHRDHAGETLYLLKACLLPQQSHLHLVAMVAKYKAELYYLAGARYVPMATPAAVPVVPVPVLAQPLGGLLKKKALEPNTFTPVATTEATPKPSVPTLKELLLKVMTDPDTWWPVCVTPMCQHMAATCLKAVALCMIWKLKICIQHMHLATQAM